MSKFKTYLNSMDKNYFETLSIEKQEDIISLIECSVIFSDENLNESVIDNVKTSAKKVGIHLDKKSGILDYLYASSANVSKLFWYAFKAMAGDKEAKEKVKIIANKEVKKEDMLDFLLKLDGLSLHMLTGPIHMIDALTGWHVGANIQKSAKTMENRALEAIKHLTKIANETKGKVKKSINSMIFKIKQLLDVGV